MAERSGTRGPDRDVHGTHGISALTVKGDRGATRHAGNRSIPDRAPIAWHAITGRIRSGYGRDIFSDGPYAGRRDWTSG